MTQLGRRFGLSDMPGSGISCGENGVFVGGVPVLERPRGPIGLDEWRPRAVSDLNRDLGKCYGLPVEFNVKISGLTAIARALGRGDLVHAQIATLHLQIPDPPALTKSAHTTSEIMDLARQLKASGLLKADWDPAKHPRWPAGSPGSIGGEFAPAGSIPGGSTAGNLSAPLIPVQLTIPVPLEVPGGIPFPSEILPPPFLPPNINPLTIPGNPYPGRPKCVKEWAEATEECLDLWADGQLGGGDYWGMGKTLHDCIVGRVSEDCGGNRLDAQSLIKNRGHRRCRNQIPLRKCSRFTSFAARIRSVSLKLWTNGCGRTRKISALILDGILRGQTWASHVGLSPI